ncbi:hypothetical protein TC41_0138 [Alicyclobacillus acidocaldarius subsp. acidocaldarius Tc-4-1]|uniref:Uncharacterized protein n=1 Tax=Alicyclobacillus acidocaldarius (strain Tc-4-1) TaxID=1048834 RepID=F8IIF7_ALIAT|nr:hypothetical protein TC41_0138 [Alicyclobacillus acidocaldarius subsp. acidocaldarius Tc-4-1]
MPFIIRDNIDTLEKARDKRRRAPFAFDIYGFHEGAQIRE